MFTNVVPSAVTAGVGFISLPVYPWLLMLAIVAPDKLYGFIVNVLDLFEDDDLISYITYILSSEIDIENTEKAIDDLINKIQKEKLIEEKNEILKKIIDSNISPEEKKIYEEKLKEVSIALAKI